MGIITTEQNRNLAINLMSFQISSNSKCAFQVVRPGIEILFQWASKGAS